jgi:hypothetical protein
MGVAVRRLLHCALFCSFWGIHQMRAWMRRCSPSDTTSMPRGGLAARKEAPQPAERIVH